MNENRKDKLKNNNQPKKFNLKKADINDKNYNEIKNSLKRISIIEANNIIYTYDQNTRITNAQDQKLKAQKDLLRNNSSVSNTKKPIIKNSVNPETASAANKQFFNINNPFINREKEKIKKNNKVILAKYNLITFLPLSLLIQFMRLANIYFLFVAILQSIPLISPLTPVTAIGPLLFVLIASMIREGYEDYKRHNYDYQLNSQAVIVCKQSDSYNLDITEQNSNSSNYWYSDNTKVNFYSWKQTESRNITLGDFVFLTQEEEIPADMILIKSAIKEEACGYIETANLDGEKGLKKILIPNDLQEAFLENQIFDILKKEVSLRTLSTTNLAFNYIQGKAYTDLPNSELYKFEGKLEIFIPNKQDLVFLKLVNPKAKEYNIEIASSKISNFLSQDSSVSKNKKYSENKLNLMHASSKHFNSKPKIVSISQKNLMLKGSKLKNTEWAIGLTVYVGHDCKLIKNTKEHKIKISNIEKLVSKFVIYILLFQISLCLITGILQSFEYKVIYDKKLFYLPSEDYSVIMMSILTFFTYLLLFNTMIPISLIITLELVKIIQGMFMGVNASLYSIKRNKPPKIGSVSINEELGNVTHIFSDKTGTLTQNQMKLKYCLIGNSTFEVFQDQKISKASNNDDVYTKNGISNSKRVKKIIAVSSNKVNHFINDNKTIVPKFEFYESDECSKDSEFLEENKEKFKDRQKIHDIVSHIYHQPRSSSAPKSLPLGETIKNEEEDKKELEKKNIEDVKLKQRLKLVDNKQMINTLKQSNLTEVSNNTNIKTMNNNSSNFNQRKKNKNMTANPKTNLQFDENNNLNDLVNNMNKLNNNEKDYNNIPNYISSSNKKVRSSLKLKIGNEAPLSVVNIGDNKGININVSKEHLKDNKHDESHNAEDIVLKNHNMNKYLENEKLKAIQEEDISNIKLISNNNKSSNLTDNTNIQRSDKTNTNNVISILDQEDLNALDKNNREVDNSIHVVDDNQNKNRHKENTDTKGKSNKNSMIESLKKLFSFNINLRKTQLVNKLFPNKSNINSNNTSNDISGKNSVKNSNIKQNRSVNNIFSYKNFNPHYIKNDNDNSNGKYCLSENSNVERSMTDNSKRKFMDEKINNKNDLLLLNSNSGIKKHNIVNKNIKDNNNHNLSSHHKTQEEMESIPELQEAAQIANINTENKSKFTHNKDEFNLENHTVAISKANNYNTLYKDQFRLPSLLKRSETNNFKDIFEINHKLLDQEIKEHYSCIHNQKYNLLNSNINDSNYNDRNDPYKDNMTINSQIAHILGYAKDIHKENFSKGNINLNTNDHQSRKSRFNFTDIENNFQRKKIGAEHQYMNLFTSKLREYISNVSNMNITNSLSNKNPLGLKENTNDNIIDPIFNNENKESNFNTKSKELNETIIHELIEEVKYVESTDKEFCITFAKGKSFDSLYYYYWLAICLANECIVELKSKDANNKVEDENKNDNNIMNKMLMNNKESRKNNMNEEEQVKKGNYDVNTMKQMYKKESKNNSKVPIKDLVSKVNQKFNIRNEDYIDNNISKQKVIYNNDIYYTGISPDDIELVNSASNQGFQLVYADSKKKKINVFLDKANYVSNFIYKVDKNTNTRYKHNHYTEENTNDKYISKQEEFEVLQIFEFTSDRKRMSIIIRDNFNNIILFSKGADAEILKRLSSSSNSQFSIEINKASVNKFSKQGFRTLLLGMRLLSDSEYALLQEELQEASISMENRQQKIAEVIDGWETELFLLGSTIVEDKLQDNVPEVIRDLRLAGIKIWMLTGDKFDTAYSIGLSCNLVNPKLHTFCVNSEFLNQETEPNNKHTTSKSIKTVTNNTEVEKIINSATCLEFLQNFYIYHEGLQEEKDFAKSMNGNNYSNNRKNKIPIRNKSFQVIDLVNKLDNPRNHSQIKLAMDKQQKKKKEINKVLHKAYSESFQKEISYLENTFSIVIDSKTLTNILADKKLQKAFFSVALKAYSVICSRISPLQKAEIIKSVKQLPELLKENEDISNDELYNTNLHRESSMNIPQKKLSFNRNSSDSFESSMENDDDEINENAHKKNKDKILVSLAIGDGGNDVSMIMEAHIGIGIYGEEGMRAAQASDFAIGEFKILRSLLLDVGRVNNIRISNMILYFFFKNFILSIIHFFFGLYNKFSGQTIIDDWFISLYNLIFTALPLAVYAVFEVDIDIKNRKTRLILDKLLPFFYRDNVENMKLTRSTFASTLFKAMLQGTVVFFFSVIGKDYNPISDKGYTTELWYFSMTIYTVVIFVVSLKLLVISRSITWIVIIVMLIGSWLAYAIGVALSNNLELFNSRGISHIVFSSFNYVSQFIFILFVCFLIDFFSLAWNFLFNKSLIERVLVDLDDIKTSVSIWYKKVMNSSFSNNSFDTTGFKFKNMSNASKFLDKMKGGKKEEYDIAMDKLQKSIQNQNDRVRNNNAISDEINNEHAICELPGYIKEYLEKYAEYEEILGDKDE